MLITNHWSGGTNEQNALTRRDYHVVYGFTGSDDDLQALRAALLQAKDSSAVDFGALRRHFTVEKNVQLGTPTSYATWKMNHDPRDSSSNVEIAMLGMGGEGVTAAGHWGEYPFTIAHAFMAAALSARVAQLKGIDTGGAFPAGPYGFENGPLHNVSTHAERAIQTPDPDAEDAQHSRWLGYFIYSGDSDSRYDIAARDYSQSSRLATAAGARACALETAQWIRDRAHEIKAAGISDMWGLDK